jgi:hypothetical protein
MRRGAMGRSPRSIVTARASICVRATRADRDLGLGGVEDVAALYAEYQAAGARIRTPPVNHSWAYEMQVEDPTDTCCGLARSRARICPFA